jgi:transposase
MKQRSDKHPTDWREARRFRGWELAAQGWKQKDIATALGVTQGAVSHWLTRARAAGQAALRRQRPPGRQPKLTPEQLASLPALLERGSEAWRFRGNGWTRHRIGIVIQETFGVTYDPSQIGRSMPRRRWRPQKPMRRARQRREDVIDRWRESEASELKKRRSPRSGP